MAVFGVPIATEDDATRSLNAALGMRMALADHNAKCLAADPTFVPLACGIGLNSGEVVCGNIGSEMRLEYTVIGDNVNLASRVEVGDAIGQGQNMGEPSST